MSFVFVLISLLPLLIGVFVVWWLVTTLNSINRNVADIAQHLGRVEAQKQDRVG